METHAIPVAEVYIPAKRRRDIDASKVEELAESMMAEGLKVPIQVRKDGARLVLVEGLHRLEAARALGEETIAGIFVGAKRY